MEDIRVASNLVNFDTSLRYITCLAIKGKKECKISEDKIKFHASKSDNVTSNDASVTPTPRSEPRSPTPTNPMSPMDKSGASINDKSQHEGGYS
jgi:transglutaminase/protease-like cytokinesis protein 3